MAGVLCVLYDDPPDGSLPAYARDDIPVIAGYPGGQTTPTAKGLDFRPRELVGSVSGELGLRTFVEAAGHELVVTSDKTRLPSADGCAIPARLGRARVRVEVGGLQIGGQLIAPPAGRFAAYIAASAS